MISNYRLSVLTISRILNFKLCLLILCFFTIVSNAQKDSLEVERLYQLGIENERVKPKTTQLNFEKAVAIINDRILTNNAKSSHFLLKKALMLDYLGIYYRTENNEPLSLKALQESLKIKKDIGETYTLSSTYRSLGGLYQHNNDSIKALEFYNKALASAKAHNNGEEIVNVLNNFSSFNFAYKDIEMGGKYAKKAYNYADSIGFDRGKSFALARSSGYERRKKNYEKAIILSERHLEICRLINDSIGIGKSFKDLGYSYRKLKQTDKAIYYYEKSLELAIKMELEGVLANRYLSLCNVHWDLKEFEISFSYYRLYKRQQIKDLNVKGIKEFEQLEAKYAYERQKSIDSVQFIEKQKIAETRLLERASTKFWKYTTIITGIFGLSFTIIILLLRRKREQVKLGKLKNEMLQNEIIYKQKDISDFALNFSRNRKWRQELLAHVKKIKKTSAVIDDTNFKALEKAVLDREIVDNNTIDFKNKVEILSNAFYEKLHKEFSSLTKTEIKLCSLIRLNIDNNGIAILQNVAIESVYTSRFRLRKKLNLSSDDDLDTFLNQF